MTLQELLNEFDGYLDQEVETTSSSSLLYRGDKRDLAEITAAGGFFPKNGREDPSIYTLLNHCAENGYGGPFISTTENPDMARKFGSNLYQIDAGMLIVADETWTRLADYHRRFKEALDAGEGTTEKRNSAIYYMTRIGTALQYNKAQGERLVINNIPIKHIHLQ